MDTPMRARAETPQELRESMECPVDRVVYVTQLAAQRRGNLPPPWTAQRLDDISLALDAGHTQPELVDRTGLSRPRVYQLAKQALRKGAA